MAGGREVGGTRAAPRAPCGTARGRQTGRAAWARGRVARGKRGAKCAEWCGAGWLGAGAGVHRSWRAGRSRPVAASGGGAVAGCRSGAGYVREITVRQLEQQRDEVRRREKIELTAADRARILGLSKNLSVVWQASTTTHAERKNLLRMLVREVTASRVDVPRPMTRVQVLWQTGAVSDFMVERKDKFTARATSPNALALIEKSFESKDDAWIAAELNRRGSRTGAGLSWTPERVHRVRHQHRWFRQPRKRSEATAPNQAGLYSAHAIAARLGVKSSTVLVWARAGILVPAERGSPGRPYRFRLDEATLERLKMETLAMDRRRNAPGVAGK